MKYRMFIYLLIFIGTSCGNSIGTKVKGTMNNRDSLYKIPKTVGIGLLEMNTKHSIPLYKDIGDTQPYDVLTFKIQKTGETRFEIRLNMAPYCMSEGDTYKEGAMHIDKGLVHFPPQLKFRVVDFTDNVFKVVVNEETMEVGFIKMEDYYVYNNIDKSPGMYMYETWEEYLKRAEFISKRGLVIYDKPGGKVIYKNETGKFLPFNVVEVSGDWIRLKKGFGREFNFDDSLNYDGWTEWKDDENILIEIVEYTYE